MKIRSLILSLGAFMFLIYGCTPATVETSAGEDAQPSDQSSVEASDEATQGDDDAGGDDQEVVDQSDPPDPTDSSDEPTTEPEPDPEPEIPPTVTCVAATEICDGVDNDCDGEIDEGVMNTYYHDADGDGYGDPSDILLSCTSPTFYVSNSTDCNDSNPSINPSASETCDGIDNNCDGEIDEGLLPSGDQITELFSSVGTDIGGDLVSSYEPSGIVWHNGLDQLFAVSDGGIITRMNADGSDVVDKVIGGDLEGVTVADSSTNFVYVGIEQPRDSIQEYNYITQSVTRTFYLDSYMVSVSANQGLEALTFVPDASSAEDGYFYTGLQETGEVFVFELPIKSSTTSTIVHFVDSFTTRYSSDISDLYYDAENDILYGLYDSANKLVAMETDGTFIREWLLPPDARYDASIDVLTDPNSQDQEGFALGDACHIFLAEDSRSVWRY